MRVARGTRHGAWGTGQTVSGAWQVMIVGQLECLSWAISFRKVCTSVAHVDQVGLGRVRTRESRVSRASVWVSLSWSKLGRISRVSPEPVRVSHEILSYSELRRVSRESRVCPKSVWVSHESLS